MVYPKDFVRLVIFGKLYSDVWNTSLSIVPTAIGEVGMPAVDDATLVAIAGDVTTWFTKPTASGGPDFISKVSLEGIKLNRIAPTGLYKDEVSKTYIYPAVNFGTGATNVPPQLAGVITLRTAISRGRGSKGRIYMPPSQFTSPVGADGRLSAADALKLATGGKTLIDLINARYTGIGRVGVASKVGTGRFEHVTKVSAGRVVDTMRSRRSKLIEEPQYLNIT